MTSVETERTLGDYLTKLWVQRGSPSARQLARELSGLVSHTTVAKILTGAPGATWTKVVAVGRHLDADVVTLRELWESTRGDDVQRPLSPRLLNHPTTPAEVRVWLATLLTQALGRVHEAGYLDPDVKYVRGELRRVRNLVEEANEIALRHEAEVVATKEEIHDDGYRQLTGVARSEP